METSRFLKPGQLLWHSQYRIERVLGHGGFGITYLATDLSLGRVVAVKEFFISSLCVHNENGTVVTTGVDAKDVVTRYKDKFLKEARNIAKFNHPNIVNIISAFEDNNTAYYVMDFLDKGSLSDMVKATGPVSVNSAIAMLEPIAGALDVIHSMKMNHLDIKPGNIMLNNVGTPVLIDFGLSKQYDYTGKETSTTPTGISHGYAPLEQYYQDGVRAFSPSLDTYALVATMYYLITGKVPPAATTLVENNIKFPDFVPWNIQRIISKGMSTKSTDRYLRATDFINELKRTVYGPKKEYHPFESTYERPRKPSGSRQQVSPEPSYQEQPKQSSQHEQSVSPSLKRSKDPIKVTVPVKYRIFGLLALFLVELSFAINAQTKYEDLLDVYREGFGEYIFQRIFFLYLPVYLIYFFIVRKILKVKLKRKIKNT